MSNLFVPGYGNKADFGGVAYDITDYNLTCGTTVLDATNSGSSQKFVPVDGVRKASGNVKMNFDALKNPTQQAGGAQLQEGKTGTLKIYITAAAFITLEVMIATINYTSNVNGLLTFDFAFEGSVTTYPTISS